MTWHSTFHNSGLWIRLTICSFLVECLGSAHVCVLNPTWDRNRKPNGNPRSAILLGSVLRKVSINTISEAKKFIQDKICKGENEEHLKCSCFFCPSFWTWFKSWDSNMSFIEIIEIFPFEVKDFPLLCYFYCGVIWRVSWWGPSALHPDRLAGLLLHGFDWN